MIGRLVSILEEGWTNTLVNLAETVLRHVYNARQAIASAKELALEIQTSVQDASSRLVWVLREDGFDDDNDNTVNQVTSKTTTTTNHTTTESRPRNKKKRHKKKKATKQQRTQWIQTEAVNLLPGDIFIMNLEQQQKQQPNHPGGGAGCSSSSSLVIPVDALVLKGECLTNEAVLTGESVPQSKVPMDFLDYMDSSDTNDATTRNVASLDQEGGKENGAVSDRSVQSSSSSSSSLTKATCLDLQHHRQSILFAGTTMVHCSSTTYPSEDDGSEQEKDEDEENDTPRKKKQNEIGTNVNGVMCLALRTGTYSSKGELLRTLQRNSHVGAISNPQSERDAIRLIGSLSVVAALSCLSLFVPLQQQQNTIVMPTTAGSTKMSHVTNGHEWSQQLRPVSGFRRVIQSTRIIVSTIPSDLPLSLSAVARTCAYQLRKEADVVCSEPGSLLTAAHVDMVVFDKVRRGGGGGGRTGLGRFPFGFRRVFCTHGVVSWNHIQIPVHLVLFNLLFDCPLFFLPDGYSNGRYAVTVQIGSPE
jgi:magnesium-transporting ATPase (P-type)